MTPPRHRLRRGRRPRLGGALRLVRRQRHPGRRRARACWWSTPTPPGEAPRVVGRRTPARRRRRRRGRSTPTSTSTTPSATRRSPRRTARCRSTPTRRRAEHPGGRRAASQESAPTDADDPRHADEVARDRVVLRRPTRSPRPRRARPRRPAASSWSTPAAATPPATWSCGSPTPTWCSPATWSRSPDAAVPVRRRLLPDGVAAQPRPGARPAHAATAWSCPGHGAPVDKDFVEEQRTAIGVVAETIRDLADRLAAHPRHRAGAVHVGDGGRPGPRRGRGPRVRGGAAQHDRHRRRDDPRPRHPRRPGRPRPGRGRVAVPPRRPGAGRPARATSTCPAARSASRWSDAARSTPTARNLSTSAAWGRGARVRPSGMTATPDSDEPSTRP